MSVQEQNLEIVGNAYAALLRGEMDGFVASFTDESEIHEVAESLPYAGVFKGPGVFPLVIGKVMEVFSALNFTKENIAAAGDNVVAWGQLELTGKSTGITVTIPLVEIWTLADGKTTKLRVIYGDTATALKAAGLA